MQGKQNDLMELLSLFNVYVRQQTILLSQTNYTIFFKVIFQNLSFNIWTRIFTKYHTTIQYQYLIMEFG